MAAVRITKHFACSPERLFAAWTEPHLVAQWLFTSPGSEKHTVDFIARVGGHWKITDRRGGVDYLAVGKFLEVDPPRRLVFSYGMPQFSEVFTTVSVDIAADGADAMMTLVHDGVLQEHIAPLKNGWGGMFTMLETIV